MNFKFTPRSTVIFVLGLAAAGLVGTFSYAAGLGLLVSVCWYLSKSEPA